MSKPRHKLAVAVMVLHPNKQILLVNSYRRGWEFPGGFVEECESIRGAAIREVLEETGIEIRLTRFCGLEQDRAQSTCVIIFEAEPIGGDLAISEESQDVRYFSLDEAIGRITLKTFKERLLRCLDPEETPFLHEIERRRV